jgi:hypothetical protein
MKKLLPILCSAALVCPAFAEDPAPAERAPAAAEAALPEAVLPEAAVPAKPAEESNPEIEFPRGMQLGIGASATSGINGFIGYSNKKFDSFWWKRLGLRFDFATTSPIKSSIDSAIDSALSGGFDVGDGLTVGGGSLSARHLGVLVDFYPFGDTWFLGGWRLSGGYMFGKLNVSANLTGTLEGLPEDSLEFELNGTMYQYSGNELAGKAGVDWKYSGPYIGTGFDLGLFWGIKIYVDAGAVFTSKTAHMGLDVPINDKLQVSTDGGVSWTKVESTAWEARFEADKTAALKEANDELGKLKFFPMAKLGLMYRF